MVESPNTWDTVTDLRRIGKILKKMNIAKRVTVVAKAKVPIVKFTSVVGESACEEAIFVADTRDSR